LKAADFSGVVGAAVMVTDAARVPAKDGLPSLCRMTATIAPSIGVEVRLPSTAWNRRFLFTGCGGLCGIINSDAGNDALRRGYAVATTDMGHRAASPEDRAWTADKALVENYVHRATHLTTVLAKEVIKSYFGRAQDFAYARGCSTGGRQGLTEALMYPADYDGIIAGAPAADMATPHNAWSYLSNLDAAGKSIIDAAAIELLRGAVLSACDADDGLADGLVGDPLSCDFDPAALACAGSSSSGCLSPAQVAGVRRMYDGAKDAAGKPFYAMGYARGSEAGWIRSMVGEAGKPPGRAGSAAFFLASVVGPDAKPADFDFARHGVNGGPLSARLDQGADNTGLAPFVGKGGRILVYHGWSEVDVAPGVSIDFYRDAVSGLGQVAVDETLRLFFIPGMAHCRGGTGPDSIDLLTAIENWVERGVAPDRLVAAKTSLPVRNFPDYPLPADAVQFTRAAFPYPATAVYAGTGDPKSADSFSTKR
jgi:feruloyl esterase